MNHTKAFFFDALREVYPLHEVHAMFQLVLEQVCNVSRTSVLLNPDMELSPQQNTEIQLIVERLKHMEPLQYVLGQTEFYGLTFEVNPSVLIPRGETEELVDMIIQKHKGQALKILDIGTGSGCIAVSLQKKLPLSNVFACDISDEALKVAEKNAKRNHVEVLFFNQDILSTNNLPGAPFDIIVSNPPYVTLSEKDQMQNNVLNYEPHSALFVPDNDPLLFYRAIGRHASTALCPGGFLYFEVNQYYAQQTLQMLETLGMDATLHTDIHNNYRIIRALIK